MNPMTNQSETKFVVAGQIYRGIEPYDDEYPEYNCYKPDYTGRFVIVDCIVCDERGNEHPEHGGSFPVYTSAIGDALEIEFNEANQ